MGVDDKVAYLLELVMFLLLLTSSNEAVTENGGLVVRPEVAEIVGEFDVEGAEVFAPDVGHVGVDLFCAQADDFADVAVDFLQGDGADAAGAPNVMKALGECAGFEIEL